MIIVEKPLVFVALTGVIPVIIFSYFSYRRLVTSVVGLFSRDSKNNARLYKRLSFSVTGRTVFRCLAWVMAVFAYAGISWGTKNVPVQKSGNAVCFVYDISYSMTARDIQGKVTRLEAARQYSKNLLSYLQGTAVSVVLAKGDGILAVPLTEDMMSVNSIINVLSPSLMSSAGSSLGRGIQAAIRSFPSNSPQNAYILVFTDGDETDDTLSQALEEAVRYGISVTVVGFGGLSDIQIITGDGKTPAMTALREEELKAKIADVNRKALTSKMRSADRTVVNRYIAAATSGSASLILKQFNSRKNTNGEDNTFFSYETQYVKRHQLFVFLSILFFIISFVAGELDLYGIRHRFMRKSAVSVIFSMMIILSCTSCSGTNKDRNSILKGTWNWYQGKYQQAVASFMQTYYDARGKGESEVVQYSLFNLASTYIAQQEYESAMDRLEQISSDPVPELKSPIYYNMGVIANRNGDFDKAIECFKESILADMNNVDAKINLELSIQNLVTKKADEGQTELQSVSEDKNESSLENGVFNLIRENEQNQWKKMQPEEPESSVLDY